jgi:hypothetical protein
MRTVGTVMCVTRLVRAHIVKSAVVLPVSGLHITYVCVTCGLVSDFPEQTYASESTSRFYVLVEQLCSDVAEIINMHVGGSGAWP